MMAVPWASLWLSTKDLFIDRDGRGRSRLACFVWMYNMSWSEMMRYQMMYVDWIRLGSCAREEGECQQRGETQSGTCCTVGYRIDVIRVSASKHPADRPYAIAGLFIYYNLSNLLLLDSMFHLHPHVSPSTLNA
jgi:hypothetical protein